jgi:predicted RNA binding protein YcfA (HicA-like mRNA interferase family)
LKALCGREFCRLLEKHGWRLRRIAGSHPIYAHPELPKILSVPVHGGKTLKQGLQQALLKAAGIDAE